MRRTFAIVVVCLAPAILLFARSQLFERSQGDPDPALPARMAARGERVPLSVTCREHALKIDPVPGLEGAVTEEDLVTVLCAALPWWNPPTVPSAFHELKLWGRHAVFTREMLGKERSGKFLVKTLLSDKECRANTVYIGGSYLLDSPFGIRPVLIGSEDAIEYRGEAHYGQLLKLLAEVGVPSTTSVTTSSGRVGDIAEIYRDALMRFSFSEELEFIACALAYWHAPQKVWKNQFGKEFTFDELLSQLLAAPLGQGSCGGCHLPYAVVIILRVDEQFPILSEDLRKQARKWLTTLLLLLEDRWSARGGWDKSWADNSDPKPLWGDEALDRIAITGHHLEWMALLPEDLRPSEALVKRAVKALRSDVESLPSLSARQFKSLLPMSHAGRALALFRSQDPYSVWLKYWKDGRLKRTNRGFDIRRPRAGHFLKEDSNCCEVSAVRGVDELFDVFKRGVVR